MMPRSAHCTILKRYCVAVIAGFGLLTNTGAHADVISGVLFGGAGVARETCYLFNATPRYIHITSAAIRGEDGSLPVFDFDSCTTSFRNFLPPGRTCGVSTAQTKVQAWACRFQTEGSTPNVTGEMDLRDAANNTKFAIPLTRGAQGF